MIHSDYISLWAPIDPIGKSGEGEAERGSIVGLCSTEAKDADGETIVQKGIDFSEAYWLTLEHPALPNTVVGEPTAFEPCTIEKGGVEIAATRVKGDLFLHDRIAKGIYNKSVTLQKAKAKQRLGLSIEGRAVERCSKDPKRILRCKVTSIAVSTQPKNPFTQFDPVMASMFARLNLFRGAEVGYPAQGVPTSHAIGALTPQSMQGTGASATYKLTTIEAMVARLLSKVPGLTWAQGVAAIEALLKEKKTK